jgi:hypothetical protein
VLLAVALLGCGDAGRSPLPAGAASQMRSHLAAVRSSATAGDRAAATRALDAFAADVSRQKAAGHLSSTAYTSLRRGISRARRRIAAEVLASVPAVVGAPVPAAAPPDAATATPRQPAPARPKGPGKPNAPGKAKAKAKGAGKSKGHGK